MLDFPRVFVQRARRIRLRGSIRYALKVISRPLFLTAKIIHPNPKVHTNACGDFTMLARQHWLSLRGYPEIPRYPLHIDSFFCYVASAAGLRERTFRAPRRMYHLEHSSSWVVLDVEERVRLCSQRPWLDYALLKSLWAKMRSDGRPYLHNDGSWGFGAYEFPEVVIRDGNREIVSRAPVFGTAG